MITFFNVRKRYKDKVIFENVNLSIDGVGGYLVKGKSGVGKTTLLNMISNIVPYEGEIENDYSDSMSYVFQSSYLIEHLTVEENLKFYGISLNFLSLYNLKDKKECFPNTLSRGERARVALIIALYKDGDLVLIDEPVTNLDKKNARVVVREILRCSKHKLIILVSHESKMFMKGLTGLINIKDKKIYLKKFKDNKKLEARESKHKITGEYVKREWLYYKKDNIRITLINFLLVFIIVIVNVASFLVDRVVDEDIKHSVDYNKFYLSECNEKDNSGVVIKTCNNPSEARLKELEINNVSLGYNYDYLLSFLYSREDLRVMSAKEVPLKEGRYPNNIYEVVTSDKYLLGESITLVGNVVINDKYDDVYKKEMKVMVVGIQNNLNFLKDDNIYFDYDYLENYFKEEYFINNNYNIYDYYQKLDINEYKYICFDCLNKTELTVVGAKYDFYSTLISVKTEIMNILNMLNMFLFAGGLYFTLKFNKEKLTVKQKSNAFLIANSYPVYKSVILSCFVDILINVIWLLLSIIFISINYWVILYLLSSSVLVILETFIYYRKKNVSNLLRREV